MSISPLKKAVIIPKGDIELIKIISAIRDIGYDVDIEADVTIRAQKEEAELKKDFILSACFSVPIMIFSMWMVLPYSNVILLLLALPVQFYVGLRFHKAAILNLKHFTADMNTLISVGTSAAFFYSVFCHIFPACYQRHRCYAYDILRFERYDYNAHSPWTLSLNQRQKRGPTQPSRCSMNSHQRNALS